MAPVCGARAKTRGAGAWVRTGTPRGRDYKDPSRLLRSNCVRRFIQRIPRFETLDYFDFAFRPAIERSRIETLALWIRNAELILMQGPPGVGKSHLLASLGVRAIQLGFSVQYSASTSC